MKKKTRPKKFEIEVKSFHTDLQEKFSEYFISKTKAEFFCKKNYKFYLWVKLNGILVIDNTKLFR